MSDRKWPRLMIGPLVGFRIAAEPPWNAATFEDLQAAKLYADYLDGRLRLRTRAVALSQQLADICPLLTNREDRRLLLNARRAIFNLQFVRSDISEIVCGPKLQHEITAFLLDLRSSGSTRTSLSRYYLNDVAVRRGKLSTQFSAPFVAGAIEQANRGLYRRLVDLLDNAGAVSVSDDAKLTATLYAYAMH